MSVLWLVTYSAIINERKLQNVKKIKKNQYKAMKTQGKKLADRRTMLL